MSWNMAEYFPPLRYKSYTTGTWGSGGNTLTITDPKIATNSKINIWVTGTTPAAGNWSYTHNSGSVTITSSAPESSTLAYAYYIE